MADWSKIGRSSRQKGSRSELKIAKMIAKSIKVENNEVCRTPASGAHIERSDLRMSERAIKRFPFFVEVKNRVGWNLDDIFNNGKLEVIKWLRESEEKLGIEIKRGFVTIQRKPIVVLLRNLKDPLVAMKLEYDTLDKIAESGCFFYTLCGAGNGFSTIWTPRGTDLPLSSGYHIKGNGIIIMNFKDFLEVMTTGV